MVRGDVTRGVGVAIAYFLAGRLAHLLALPPSYASPVWPAAGVALGALLLFGHRMGIAVFLGALATNISIARGSSPPAISALLALGATLQAIVGAQLIRRRVGPSISFDQPTAIIRAMILGGPVACWIAASIATCTFVATDVVSSANAPAAWATWWLGDAIGAILIVPLAAVWQTEVSRAPIRMRALVVAPIAIFGALTIVAFTSVREKERSGAYEHFVGHTASVTERLRQRTKSHEQIVRTIASVFAHVDTIDEETFTAIVTPILERHPGLHAISFNRIVTHEERLRSAPMIFEKDSSGGMVEAAARDEYVVITYIEPLAKNRAALAFDLRSESVRRRAIETARRTNAVAATAPIQLVQLEEHNLGVVLFAPIVGEDGVVGCISGVLRADGLVQPTLATLETQHIGLRIEDTTDGTTSAIRDVERAKRFGLFEGLEWTSDVDVGGRSWHLEFWPDDGFVAQWSWTRPWLTMTGGLLFTSLLGAFLLVIVGRSATLQRAHDSIQESERRFRAVFEATTLGLVLTTPDDVVVLANETFASMQGRSAAGLVGQPLGGQTRPEVFGDTADGRRTTFSHRDGHEIVTLQRTVEVGNSPTRPLLLHVFEDVTVRDRMERELVRSQRLESLGKIAGGIAHDFNNILTAVAGHTELAIEHLPVQHRAAMEDARRSLLRASGLTTQLLTFARGGAPITKHVDLAPLIHDVVESLQLDETIECRYDLPTNLLAALCDAAQIRQVLTNVIDNALLAMPDGGTLEISARSTTDREPAILVSVRDDGEGIKPDDLPQVCDPYFSTRPEASGLGLASAYSIMKRHDGDLTIVSEPGAGTTVTLRLLASRATAPPTTPRPTLDAGGKRVLVMDDEHLIRSFLQRALKRSGYDVVVSADGAEAIRHFEAAILEGRPFDAVVLDLTIPDGLGGKETILRLLEIDPTVRAIVSSGYFDDPVVAQYRDHGFSGVVRKPYQMSQMTDALERIISGETYAD